MATKKEWQAYLKLVKKYAKDLEKWVGKLKPGDVSTANLGSNPPSPPPPPPGTNP